MRTIATILLIFLAQCTYLHAEPKLIVRRGILDSCAFGVKSVFFLRYNSHDKGINVKNDDQICNDLDSSQPVVFIVHGFISSASKPRIQLLVSHWVQKGYTVIAVDWSQGACTKGNLIMKSAGYPFAVKNTRPTGRHYMAKYINALIKRCNVPLKNIILIGHSLGAHVCGFAAKEVQKSGLGTIPLIIAADPAKPMFDDNESKKRLCKSDAVNVIVFHTSILGMSEPIGHLDLYFNGGAMQPGCDMNIICSHSRAISYITDMIRDNCGFPGVPLKESFDLLSYPDSNTTDCIIVDSKLLNSYVKGQYYVFVDDNTHCQSKTFNCTQ